ncbi:MAG: translesion error-prone DNA polymerase V autoproteolytic subunit [Chlamydiia bacterium]|nr:translesion error-prone DNA polymerase V autoproteolytic subunit [Chlamydiia bacterium]MCP5509773.1 translesion error-prone DNA polymerase V autoproteolytic subunit [Chlamydiales bacterium]HPE85097.1 translesion error-prone DNA polymerase V autoproteolytic subunit [Chlamydiales bacterium]
MMKLPVYLTRVRAGFPTPNEGEIEEKLDLNEYLIQHPAATFFVRVEGSSMIDAGITEGDLLIVDRAKHPQDGDVILAVLDGEFTVKRLSKQGKLFLEPANQDFAPIEITEEMDFQVWGVVTYTVRKCSR